MGENAKRLFFVYNPHSGRGNIRSKLFDIVQVFSEAGYEITTEVEYCDVAIVICQINTIWLCAAAVMEPWTKWWKA